MKIILFCLVTVAALFVLSLGRARAEDKLAPTATLQKIASGAVVLDVRSPEEFSSGHLEGARNILHDLVRRCHEASQV